MTVKLSDFPIPWQIYFLLLAELIGLVLGSFFNAWAWRIAHHEKISHGRSHCTACGHVLSARDLIPLYSWISLRGKCRYCGAPIPARYPVTEALSMVFALTIFLRSGFTIRSVEFLITGELLLAISLVDLETMEIPDRLTIGVALLSLLRLAEGPGVWKDMLIGGLGISVPLLLLVLVMEAVSKHEAMGGGDIKLIAALGLHFGSFMTLFLLIVSCFVGLIMAVIWGKGTGKEFPFGPSIAVSAWITMLFGAQAVMLYLKLF